MSTEDTPKPAAFAYWNERMGYFGCSLHRGGTYLDPERRPLFDQATIDAAVAKERERCAKIVDEYNPGGSYHIRTALAAEIRRA